MADDYLPPVIAEVLLRIQGFEQGAAKVRAEMDATATGVSGSAGRMSSDVEKETKKVEGSSRSMAKVFGESMTNLGTSIGFAGAPLRGFGREITETDMKARGLAGALHEVGRIALIGTFATFAGAAYESVKAVNAFQTSLAQIAADSNQANAQAIGKAFLGTMGSSAFSATELAAAYATVSQQLRVIEGHTLGAAGAMKVMTASSDLAEGAQTDLGTATAAIAQVMQAYHLSVNQASSAADTLYSTSRATDSGIGSIAQAMGRLHARLGEATPSLKDVGGLMVAAAQTGLTGSRGILQMSGALQSLLGNSTTVQSVLRDLGVSVTDAKGQFIGMPATITALRGAFAGLSPQLRLYAADTLFGKGAAQTLLQVIEKGPAAFAQDAAAADKSGSAHNAAAQQAKTLHHQLEVMRATLDDLAVHFGQILVPVIQKAGSAIASVIGWFDRNKGAAIALATVISGVLGAAIAVFVTNKIAALITGTENLVIGFSKVASALTGGMIPALERTGPGITGIGVRSAASEAQVASLGAQAATTGAEVETLGSDAAIASGQLSLFGDELGALEGEMAAAGAQAQATAADFTQMGLAARLGIAGAVAGIGFMATGGASGWSPSQPGKSGLGLGSYVLGSGTHDSNNLGDVLGEWNPFGSHFNHPVHVPNERPWTVKNLEVLQKGLNGVTNATALSTEQLKKFYGLTQQLLTSGDITAKQRYGLKQLQSMIDPATVAQYERMQREAQKALKTSTSPEHRPGRSLSLLEQMLNPNAAATPQARQAATLTLQTTQTTDTTKILTDAANAQTTIVKDQQALVSERLQAAAKSITDAAGVVQAKLSAAATAITNASSVAHDRSAAVVQAIQDSTQVQTDILGERMLYGYQLVAQRLTVQYDVLKEGFDKQISLMQANVDEIKQHWDGKIAADQIEVARVTQHQDQLVAAAQQRATQVQMHSDTLLANATNVSDTTQLANDIKVALAQNAETLASKTQKAGAQQALTLAQAQAGLSNAAAAKSLATVTSSATMANTVAAGLYQQAQDLSAKQIAQVQAKLSTDQNLSTRAEARAQAQLQRLQDQAAIQEARLQSQIALAQAGGGRRIRSDEQALAYTPGGGGPLAVGPETAYSRGTSSRGLTINGGVHIHGTNMTDAAIVNEFYMRVRPMLTGPPLNG